MEDIKVAIVEDYDDIREAMRSRRLWKSCERKFNTSLQFVVLAFISLLIIDYEQVLRQKR
jgi:hypothetical protein